MKAQTQSKSIRAVPYARSAVENKAALEMQLTQCREYCHANELSIVAEIHEFGFSGNSLNRPGLIKLRELVERREVDAVVIASIDRLGRRIDQVTELVREIEQAGVCLRLTKGD